MAAPTAPRTTQMWSPSKPSELISFNTESGENEILLTTEDDCCSQYERRALESLVLDASAAPRQGASLTYRSTVSQCIQDWSENFKDGDSRDPLLALETSSQVMQLSEIYLPLTDHLSPGLVTADTVRYLRNHHSRLPYRLDSPEILQELHRSNYVTDRPCFWHNVTTAVVSGRLQLASEMLLDLPILQNVLDGSEDIGTSNEEQMEKRQMLPEIYNLVTMLRKAPIPGSPYDDVDDGFHISLDNTELYGPRVGEFGEPDRRVAMFQAGQFVAWEPSLPVFAPTAASQALRRWQELLMDLSFPLLCKYLEPLGELLAILSGRSSPPLTTGNWWEVVLCQVLYQTPTLRPRDMINRIAALVAGTKDDWIIPILQGGANETLASIVGSRRASPLQAMLVRAGGAGGDEISTFYFQIVSIISNFSTVQRALWFDVCVEEWKVLAPDDEVRHDLVCSTSEALFALSGSDDDYGAQLAVQWIVSHAARSKRRTTLESNAELLTTTILEKYVPSSDGAAMQVLQSCEPLLQGKRLSILVLDGCLGLLQVLFQRHIHCLDIESSWAYLQEEDISAVDVDQNFESAARAIKTGLELEQRVHENAHSTGRTHRFLAEFCSKICRYVLELLSDPEDTSPVDPSLLARAKGFVQACQSSSEYNSITELGCFREMQAVSYLYFVTMSAEEPSPEDYGTALAGCLEVCCSIGNERPLLELVLRHVRSNQTVPTQGSVLGDRVHSILDRYGDKMEMIDPEAQLILLKESTNQEIARSASRKKISQPEFRISCGVGSLSACFENSVQ